MIEQHTPASAATLGLPARIAGFRASHWDLNALWQLCEGVRDMLRAGLYAEADSSLEFGFDQSVL